MLGCYFAEVFVVFIQLPNSLCELLFYGAGYRFLVDAFEFNDRIGISQFWLLIFLQIDLSDRVVQR